MLEASDGFEGVADSDSSALLLLSDSADKSLLCRTGPDMITGCTGAELADDAEVGVECCNCLSCSVTFFRRDTGLD